jgi:hypothetical protein
VKQVVKIDLPKGFRVRGQRKIFARLLTRDAYVEPTLIDATRTALKFDLLLGQLCTDGGREVFAASLPIAWRL